MMNDFEQIDNAINRFLADKNISLFTDSASDWLIFEWRQLRWEIGALNYLLEIYPSFDNAENIKYWIFYGAVSYDINDTNYYFKKEFLQGTLPEISLKLPQAIDYAYNYILEVKKDAIPIAYP